MKPITLSGLLMFWLLAACSHHGDGKAPALPKDAEIEALFAQQANGEYAACVDAMHSCDSLPEDYRQELALLFKQRARKVAADKGKIDSIRVNRTAPCHNGRTLKAYLVVSYANGEHEELLLHLVHDGEQWRLR